MSSSMLCAEGSCLLEDVELDTTIGGGGVCRRGVLERLPLKSAPRRRCLLAGGCCWGAVPLYAVAPRDIMPDVDMVASCKRPGRARAADEKRNSRLQQQLSKSSRRTSTIVRACSCAYPAFLAIELASKQAARCSHQVPHCEGRAARHTSRTHYGINGGWRRLAAGDQRRSRRPTCRHKRGSASSGLTHCLPVVCAAAAAAK